jgi:hypothetical protein
MGSYFLNALRFQISQTYPLWDDNHRTCHPMAEQLPTYRLGWNNYYGYIGQIATYYCAFVQGIRRIVNIKDYRTIEKSHLVGIR